MADYATIDELREHLPEAESEDEDRLGRTLTRVSRFIDSYTGNSADYFAKAGDVPTAKTFHGAGGAYLGVPPYVVGSITKVMVNGAAVTGYLEQRGYLVFPPTLDRSTRKEWIAGSLIEVTARWGWVAVPAEIVEACILICMHRETAGAERLQRLIGEQGQGTSAQDVPAPPSALLLLAPYKAQRAYVA